MSESNITRRQFVQTAGAASVALAAAGAVETERYPIASYDTSKWRVTSDKKIRVGVVGGGFGSQFHWHLDPNCIVAAVSDLRPDRRKILSDTYKCDKVYESLEKLILDKNIDAVAVFTGAPDHARHCIAVMDTGKHCLCAVPAAITLEECHDLIEARKRNGVGYMMAETSHYRQPSMFMRRRYREGDFGEVLYSEIEYYHPMLPNTPERERLWYYDGKPTWRHCYPPMLYPTHCTDYLIGNTDERLVEVSCQGILATDDPEMENNQYDNPFNTETALLKTDRGHLCRLVRSRELHVKGVRAQWFGKDTAAYMPSEAGQPFLFQKEGQPDFTEEPDYRGLLPEPLRIRTGHGNSHAFLVREFITSLIDERKPTVDIYLAVAETTPGIVAHQSALKGGEWMKIPSFDPPA